MLDTSIVFADMFDIRNCRLNEFLLHWGSWSRVDWIQVVHVAIICEHGNEPSGARKVRVFIVLSDCKLLKKVSTLYAPSSGNSLDY
jgi:hypothetical protein